MPSLSNTCNTIEKKKKKRKRRERTNSDPSITFLNASPVQQQQQSHDELVPRLCAVDVAALPEADLQTFCATIMADLAVYDHCVKMDKRR